MLSATCVSIAKQSDPGDKRHQKEIKANKFIPKPNTKQKDQQKTQSIQQKMKNSVPTKNLNNHTVSRGDASRKTCARCLVPVIIQQLILCMGEGAKPIPTIYILHKI